MKTSIIYSLAALFACITVIYLLQTQGNREIVESKAEGKQEDKIDVVPDLALSGDKKSSNHFLRPIDDQPIASQSPDYNDPALHFDKNGVNRLEFTAHAYRTNLTDELWSINPSDLDALKIDAKRGDPDSAYMLFMYYMDCYGMASSERTYKDTLKGINVGIKDAASSGDFEQEAYLIELHEHTLKLYHECNPSRQDYQLSAYKELKRAAENGHVLAQIDFSSIGKSLITHNDQSIINPNLIHEFKAKAMDFLRLASLSGHPEALLKVAREYDAGAIVDTDPFLAYAYVIAYEEAAKRTQNHAKGGMDTLIKANSETLLTIRERKDARIYGFKIFDEVFSK